MSNDPPLLGLPLSVITAAVGRRGGGMGQLRLPSTRKRTWLSENCSVCRRRLKTS